MTRQLTAQNATAAQIEHHLEFVLLPRIRFCEELLRLDPDLSTPISIKAKRDLAKWMRTFNYFVGPYKKKGGRDMAVDVPTHYAWVAPPQQREQKARADMRRAVANLSSRCQTWLSEVRRGVRTIIQRRQNMVDMAFTQAGGLNVANMLVYMQARMIKPAEKALRQARMS